MKKHFSKKANTNGQSVHEEVFKFISHQGNANQNSKKGFPGGPVLRTWCFHSQARMQDLVGEQRSHKLHSVDKKKKTCNDISVPTHWDSQKQKSQMITSAGEG